MRSDENGHDLWWDVVRDDWTEPRISSDLIATSVAIVMDFHIESASLLLKRLTPLAALSIISAVLKRDQSKSLCPTASYLEIMPES